MKRRLSFLILPVLLAVPACGAPQADRVRAATKTASETAATATPRIVVAPAREQHVAAAPSPAPTPTLTPHPHRSAIVVPLRAPDAPPQIVAVQVNTTDVGSGDTLWGKVLTSSNVASVEVRVATYGVGLQKVGVGRFTLEYQLGSIPFFVRGTYPMRIIARNTRGDAVERSLPLTIH